MRRRVASALSVLALGAAFSLFSTPAAGAPAAQTYRVRGLEPGQEILLDRAGAVVTDVDEGAVYVKARPDQAAKLRKQGLKVDDMSAAALAATFGPVDPGYTDYSEMKAEVSRLVGLYPTLASQQVIGKSYEGKDIVALKISDNVGVDESEPEMLFTANQHAREHLTVEMALYLANTLLNDYGSDPAITKIVDNREIWIVPMVNPDGAQYDVDSGDYLMWRKNRQPNSGSTEIGTDLNRNWGYKWGCCAGSSGVKSKDTYRGSAAFSAKETQVIRDFVLSRRIGGTQQITEHLDIHTYSQLVLWPFGYTTSTVVGPMTADAYAAHRAIGTEMADRNGYWPGQASGLYIADGIINDWMWADQKIFSFTFEMYPKRSDLFEQFYPPASVIPAQTSRNRQALIRLAQYADCPYRSISKENTYCPVADDYTLTVPGATYVVAQGGTVATTITATKTTGANQLVSLTATGAPAGMTPIFGLGSIPTDGSAQTISFSTAATTTPGEYTVVVRGDGTAGTVRTAPVTIMVTGSAACQGANATDVAIPDDGTPVTSSLAIAGCGSLVSPMANASARLEVHIAHTNIGDLQLRLIGPGGAVLIHDRDGADMNNIDKIYTLDLSGQTADGTWSLEATDLESGSTGKIDSWTLTLK
ncbi:M14 family zinc carboxypeptidase [Hamadaea sp. NPDC051192]|uniref:M14 family zinc carboxypeptidase n=1 Tax=Hamadaea sp. NPDC051192 TaxID=3154940 RepID=UPI003424FA47